MAIAITLHILAAVIWVGGMFFAYLAARPAAKMFELPQRAALWASVLDRFFPWVWAAALLLPVTGYWMVYAVFEGFGNVGLHVHIMQVIGWAMIAIFMHMYFAPFPRLRLAVSGADWDAALRALIQIRKLSAVELILGLIVTAVATGGAYFGAFLQSLGD
jgi:uncharacterized membrane protein